MVSLAPGWDLAVERGPDWLFVKLHCARENVWDSPPLADAVWNLLEQHFTHRLVIECDELIVLHSSLISELVRLDKRVAAHGGVLRLCGLTEMNRRVLESCQLSGRFATTGNRAAAVLGERVATRR
jgi:anti-anti-sigma regulatory factor